MKINVVIPSFYPAVIYGGPIVSTYHACTELAKLKDIFITVSTTNANMKCRLDVATDRWIPLNQFYVKYYNETFVGKFSFSLFLKIWKDIKESDVVHIQAIFNASTPISLFYSKLYQKPVLLSPRGCLGEWCLRNKYGLKKFWLTYIIGPLLGNTVWHSTSLQEKKEILNIFPNAEVSVIPNGIEYETYMVSDKFNRAEYINKYTGLHLDAEKIVISMGRIHVKKGFDILINSFAAVVKEFPTAKLLIAGDDEGELPALLSLIQKLKLTKAVFFVGPVSGRNKINFFANADLFCLPSHNENFGNVYVESLAAGTPIVASTNTPWSEVEDGQCGKWVPNDIKPTSDAMIEMLRKDMQAVRQYSQRHASNYDWGNIAMEFKKLFEKLIHKN